MCFHNFATFTMQIPVGWSEEKEYFKFILLFLKYAMVS